MTKLTKEQYWKNYTSEELCRDHHDAIDIWWDADLFDWDKYSWYLAMTCVEHISIWWNTHKYNWKKHSSQLLVFCKSQFNIWWSPSKWDWDNETWSLHICCSDKFSDLQLKKLLFHKEPNARAFAKKELDWRSL